MHRYGAEAGQAPLRELIASKMYPGGQVKASEVFVSDGSKCDISRLQILFGKGISVAVQVLLFFAIAPPTWVCALVVP